MKILATLTLFLPAIVPSWRFFDTIAPSPRLEFRLLTTTEDDSNVWQEFRPIPRRLSLSTLLTRMVWNPHWNETLFLVSCSERLMEDPAGYHSQEIATRMIAALGPVAANLPAPRLQFRLVVVSRKGDDLQRYIAYISPLYSFKTTFS